jgi:hypothetical protein
MGLGLTASATASRAAAKAAEIRRADSLLRGLLDGGARPGPGRDEAFSWRYDETTLPNQGPSPAFQLCLHAAVAVSLRNGATYHLNTAAPCSASSAAS